MALADLAQLVDRKAVADHPVVGDDIGGAVAAVEQRHLAERDARPERGDADDALAVVFGIGLETELDGHGAAGDDEEQVGLVALGDDRLARLEDHRPDEALENAQVVAWQAGEDIELAE